VPARNDWRSADKPGCSFTRTRATTAHVCDPETCGIDYDPDCPVWQRPDHPRGSPGWLRTCSADERAEWDAEQEEAAEVKRILSNPLATRWIRRAMAAVRQQVLKEVKEVIEALAKQGGQ
jgi:hypothetical protein